MCTASTGAGLLSVRPRQTWVEFWLRRPSCEIGPTPYNSSPSAITAACEASLTRLRVDVIDLYQIHRPDLFAHPAELPPH